MSRMFDELSKAIGDEALPRRESLRRLGLVITATVLGPLSAEFARAGHHPKPAKPKPPQDPCKAFCTCRNSRQKDQCLKACKACAGNPQRLGGSCGNYFCCGAGQVSCGDYCADLAYDSYNCGACGYECPDPGQHEEVWCFDGVCMYGCEPGAVDCDGACTFLDLDPNNCGACGNVCPSGTICVEGECYDAGTPCAGGLTLCNGVCVNIYADTLNCGACGHACADYQTCTGGICEYPW